MPYRDRLATAIQLLWTLAARSARLPPLRAVPARRIFCAFVGPELHGLPQSSTMDELVARFGREVVFYAGLSSVWGLACVTGCTSAPPAEKVEADPLAEWTKRARPESVHDHAIGLSGKARETERRLGYR